MDLVPPLAFLSIGVAIGAAAMALLKKPQSRKTRRRTRIARFVEPGSGSSGMLSPNLLTSAYVLLNLSLDDRKRPVFRTADNHFSPHAPGVLVLVVTAFDAWLCEILNSARPGISMDVLGETADLPTVERLKRISRTLCTAQISPSPDFRLAVDLRHEVIHFLPYVQDISASDTIPDWLREAGNQNIFMSAKAGRPQAPGELHFSQRLCSYALGYWACQTVHKESQALTVALDPSKMSSITALATAGNFGFYSQGIAPDKLGPFDSAHGLTIT